MAPQVYLQNFGFYNWGPQAHIFYIVFLKVPQETSFCYRKKIQDCFIFSSRFLILVHARHLYLPSVALLLVARLAVLALLKAKDAVCSFLLQISTNIFSKARIFIDSTFMIVSLTFILLSIYYRLLISSRHYLYYF